MTQSITGLSHIDKDTELMKRSTQRTKTHNTTKNDRHENNNGLRDCHYCWCLTRSFCVLERTIRLCQSNEPHRASTYCTDGDLDRGESMSNTERREERRRRSLQVPRPGDTFPLCPPDSFPISFSTRVYCCWLGFEQPPSPCNAPAGMAAHCWHALANRCVRFSLWCTLSRRIVA